MSELLVQAQLAEDRTLLARCAAAAARAGEENPSEWAQRNSWRLAITPGWESVQVGAHISDSEVIAAVARLLGKPEPEPEPEPTPDAEPELEVVPDPVGEDFEPDPEHIEQQEKAGVTE